MNREYLIRLRNEFYDWCSLLSLDEAASNEKLIAAIEHAERSLVASIQRQDFYLAPQNEEGAGR